tara:strand:+ start:202 stop:1071 length:870 start_codon:yes stop_codon:yes gene_type:complete
MPILKQQSTEWDFDVDHIPAPSFEHNGLTVKPDHFLNVRRDTGEVLGVASNRYGVVQNRDLIGVAEDAFGKSDLGSYDRSVIVTGKGEKLFATYDFKDRNRALKVGDEVGMRLTLQNSFDTTLRLSFAIGALRLVCTNGMTTMERDVDMTSKHNSNVDVNFLSDSVKVAVERFDAACTAFDKLSEVQFDHDKGFNVLNRLAQSKVISDRQSTKIAAIWASPDYKEDQDRTLWNLYNASTQYLSREVEGKRYELASKTNLKILKNLSRIASTGTINQWTAPVPVDAVVNN